MLLEDIVIYAIVFLSDVLFDPGYLLLLNLKLMDSETGAHPFSFGLSQISIAFFCAFQLYRKIRQLRYYA